MKEKTAEKKWKRINHAATSLGEPKSAYLPGNPKLNISRRIAEFELAFTLPREFLEVLANRGKRLAGLSERAIGFLQFRLAVLLTRLAQDDFAWPSQEDLKIKIESLVEQIANAEKKKTQKATELQTATQCRDELEADLDEAESLITRLNAAKTQAEGFLMTADDLAE